MSTADMGYAELERMGALRIGKPHPVRGLNGRMERDHGAEWDWYYALPDDEREYVRRFHMVARGVRPDDLAQLEGFGTDVDACMGQWIAAVRLTRDRSDSAAMEWERASFTAAVAPSAGLLVGPAEVALICGVKPSTVHQWVQRDILPAPWDVVSGTRLWPRHVILEWAIATGRMAEEWEEQEAF